MSPVSSIAPVLVSEQITTTEGLGALAPEWAELWERCPGATPFQAPEWLLPWWRRFGSQPGWKLWSWALRCNGQLMGLAPLFMQPLQDGSVRQVTGIGIGITDYLDILLDSEVAAEGAALFLAHLAEHRTGWDVCDLQHLPAGSPLLHAPVPPGLEAEVLPDGVCPVVPLPATPDELFASLAGWMRRNLRQGQRRLEQMGELRFETANTESLPEILDAFFRLHGKRWEDQGLPGVLRGEEIQEYHREVAAGLLARGILRMHGVRVGGRLRAVFYGFLHRSRAYAYLSGFDPALGRCSPGTVTVGHVMREAIREGAREFDFLRGAEDYKYDWGGQDQPAAWLRIRPVNPSRTEA